MPSKEVDEHEFDVSSLDSVDSSEMVVLRGDGTPSTWVWTFAGPGHEQTVAQSARIARERLARDAAKEQAQVNGKKWKPDEQTPDETLRKNVRLVTDRLLGWTPVKFNGEPFEFSEANAKKLLLDPRKNSLLKQALDFLGDETAFIQRS